MFCTKEQQLYQQRTCSRIKYIKVFVKQLFKKIQRPRKSFRFDENKCETELSKGNWRLKTKKDTLVVTWKIVGKDIASNINSRECSLCLNDKLKTVLHIGANMLNKWK